MGRLIGVHVSSIVNEAINTISSQFTKRFWIHKNANQTKASQQNKNKRTKKTKGKNFSHRKTSKRVKIVCFAFLKKIGIALIASFTILLKGGKLCLFCGNILKNLIFNLVVLSVLDWCKKKAYLATAIEKNVRLFVRSQM